MEVGFVTVPTNDFTTQSSVVTNITKPRVIMGLPRDGGPSLNSGYSCAARVKNVGRNAVTGQVTFMSIFYNRAVRPASVATTQTMNDYRFVTFREVDSNNNAAGVSLYLQLHNYDKKWHPRIGNCINGHYTDLYDNNRFRQAYTMTYETVAVLGYTPNYVVTCEDGIVFESHQIDGITSDPRWLAYYWYFKKFPGVFGMVNSFKGGDQVTIRSFNYTLIGVGVILQEDQCDKPAVLHLQGERLSFFVAGQVDLTKSVANPYSALKSHNSPNNSSHHKSHSNPDRTAYRTTDKSAIGPAEWTTNRTTLGTAFRTAYKFAVDATNRIPDGSTFRTAHESAFGTAYRTTNRFTFRTTDWPSYIPTNRTTDWTAFWTTDSPTNSPTNRTTNWTAFWTTDRTAFIPTNISTNNIAQFTTHITTYGTAFGSALRTAYWTAHSTTHGTAIFTAVGTAYISSFLRSKYGAPSGQPTSQPTSQPSAQPSGAPSGQPTAQPSAQPSGVPITMPSGQPSSQPTGHPSVQPTSQPSAQPSGQPTALPSEGPSSQPSSQPSGQPSSQPTGHPSSVPSAMPSSKSPTFSPSLVPTARPSLTFPPVCVHFILADTFGDGWDTAQFFMYDQYGKYDTKVSSCEQNVVLDEYCFNPQSAIVGDTVNATVFGYRPDHPWEILWRAVLVDSGDVYTGSYKTEMTFSFNRSSIPPYKPYISI
eukprot:gene42121-biopygen5602